MSPAPRVSVVIPVRDDAVMLERCLEALAQQTTAPHEIIVVDNDSSDLTPTVAAWWGARCVFEAQHGIPAAASAGYDAAEGDVIARLDADSVPGREWVERIGAVFADDRDLAAVTGPGSFPSLPRPLRTLADVVYMQAYFGIFAAAIGQVPVFGSNFAMTRAAWRDARDATHREDAEVHDDLDLSFRLPRDGAVRVERDLHVDISARPFGDPSAFARRVGRGFHTVYVNRDALRGVQERRATERLARERRAEQRRPQDGPASSPAASDSALSGRGPRPLISAALGQALKLAMAAIMLVRRPKPIHAHGVVLEGGIRRVGPPARSGIAWIDEQPPTSTPVLARASRSLGTPAPLPDVVGLALRVDGPDGPADLELASTGFGFPSRFWLTLHRSPSRARLGTLLPYRGTRGPVLICARTLGPERLPSVPGRLARVLERTPWRLRLYWATPTGRWRAFAEVELRRRPGPIDPLLRFDAVENPLPGAGTYAWTRALRSPSYRLARRSGDSTMSESR